MTRTPSIGWPLSSTIRACSALLGPGGYSPCRPVLSDKRGMEPGGRAKWESCRQLPGLESRLSARRAQGLESAGTSMDVSCCKIKRGAGCGFRSSREGGNRLPVSRALTIVRHRKRPTVFAEEIRGGFSGNARITRTNTNHFPERKFPIIEGNLGIDVRKA